MNLRNWIIFWLLLLLVICLTIIIKDSSLINKHKDLINIKTTIDSLSKEWNKIESKINENRKIIQDIQNENDILIKDKLKLEKQIQDKRLELVK